MRVSVFITCLVDQFYPRVGLALVEVLERLGVETTFNPEQVCCGQPAFNLGYRREARELARCTLGLFEHELETADFVVAPSGSCTSMVKNFYPELFAGEPETRGRAERVGRRLYEFSQLLAGPLGVEDVGAAFGGRVTYHDSCHLRSELGVCDQPRQLIKAVSGVEYVEMGGAEACCGFGGAFSVKYPEISGAIAGEKAARIGESGAEVVVTCDAGCLMQMSGWLGRAGAPVRCLHLAELLASREG